jgi:hypothetical protein
LGGQLGNFLVPFFFTKMAQAYNMGFCASWADGINISFCNSIQLQFRLTEYYQLLFLTSTLYFQSAAVPGRRNAISQPAQSPVRCASLYSERSTIA